MKWSIECEEALHVIMRIFIRQLGLPEATTIITDFESWNRLYPESKLDPTKYSGKSMQSHYVVWINVDDCNNFYDVVQTGVHELFHLKRFRVSDEFKIEQWASKWINSEHYTQVDLSKL